MGKLTLNESEKTKIRQLHGLNGTELINEQMNKALNQRKCRKEYAKKSEKLTKKGYTIAEEGEDYEEGYKIKTVTNGLCEDERWVKAKKSIGDRITGVVDKRNDGKVGKREGKDLNDLNSDVISVIVGNAIGTKGGGDAVNLLNSDSWVVPPGGGVTDYYATALNAIYGMLQLAATVETLNSWIMSDSKSCYDRKVTNTEIHDEVNLKYIKSSPRKALIALDRITRGLTIRNEEIKQLKEVVSTFKASATNFWNETEKGLGGSDEIITNQFKEAGIRDIRDMFRRNMSKIAEKTSAVVDNVTEQLKNGCSVAKSETSVKNSGKKNREYR